MNYRIVHNIIGFEKISFSLGVTAKTKQTRNDYYPNLSNCCSAYVKQRKFCEYCSKDVTEEEHTHKEFKLSKKDKFKFPAVQLDRIQAQLDSNEIKVIGFYKISDILLITDFAGNSQYVEQSKGYEADYLQYREILRSMGKVALCEITIRNRPYIAVMYAHISGSLELQPLHYQYEINEASSIIQKPINSQLIQLLAEIGNIQSQKNNGFNELFPTLVNMRKEKETELLQLVVSGKELPKVEAIVEQKVEVDNTEMERLQQLLNQIKK